MLGSVVIYTGLVIGCVGLLNFVKPFRVLRVRTRPQGALITGLGLLAVIVGFTLPTREKRVVTPSTRLDQFAPAWQFSEFHTIEVDAPPDQVFQAIKAVRADEILLFRTLTWIRRLGRPGPESILDPSERLPLLDVATGSGFLLLAEDTPRELVIGTFVMVPPEYRSYSGPVTPEIYRSIRRPGFALASMNFLVKPDGDGGSVVTTETRVFATSIAARRQFAAYWRVIYPGSAIIRRMWLRAIQRRAEAVIS